MEDALDLSSDRVINERMIKQYEGNEMNLVLVRHEEDTLEVMFRFRVKYYAA